MSRFLQCIRPLTISAAALLVCQLELGAQQLAGDAQPSARTAPRAGESTDDPIARIRDEGLNRSQLMDTLTYLTDVIGPRLTGSPAHKRANEWTRDTLVSWGLSNAHLEAWGPFGRGWSLKRFSAQVIEPQAVPLAAAPLAWSCGADKPIVADVVYLDAKTQADLEKFKGRLQGAIVLVSSARTVEPRFEPLAYRLAEADLLRLANAAPGRSIFGGRSPSPAVTRSNVVTRSTFSERLVSIVSRTPSDGAPPRTNAVRAAAATNQPPARPPRQIGSYDRIPFAVKEGAAVIVTCSGMGDGGTMMVGSAFLPPPTDTTNRAVLASRLPWSTNAPAGPPQITVAMEDYNRLVHMIERGEKLKMAVELQAQFHTDDLMAYNTIADIPGTDRPDELVMLGAHLDSLSCGTGATDDAAGVAVCMEAARILQTLKLQPRRTIRLGLWAGEEQGLLGSKAYVHDHFGYRTNATNTAAMQSPKEESQKPVARRTSSSSSERKLVRQRDYDKLSVYFNLDNGTGKIRGVYLQGNEAVRPLFRRWLEPFRDLGAETLTAANTGGTDHLSFDAIGLPGFQFIQDPIDYSSRTHHTTADVSDRIQAEDLKQAAVIMAAFAYQAATMDELLPRKPEEKPQERPAVARRR